MYEGSEISIADILGIANTITSRELPLLLYNICVSSLETIMRLRENLIPS